MESLILKPFALQSIFCVLVLLSPRFSSASVFDSDSNSARFNASGRTGVAGAGRNIEELFILNPALLATKSSIGLFGSYAKGDMAVAQNQRQISFGILDSSVGTWDPQQRNRFDDIGRFPIASAVTYTRIKNDRYRDQLINLGLAQAMSANLAIGLLGNYSFLQSRVGGRDKNYFDLGIGIVYRATNWLSLGLSSQNLLDSRKDFESPHLRRAVGAGAQVQISSEIFLRADLWSTKNPENDENAWVYRLGMENHLTENIHFRAGFSEDKALKTKVLGLGLGLVGPRLSVHYGFQRETSLGNVMHSVDLHLPIW